LNSQLNIVEFDVGSAKIWLLDHSTLLEKKIENVLTRDEQKRCDAFLNIKRKKEFIAARILKNELFSSDSIIEYNEIGAPFVSGAGHISISHANNLVAIANCKDYKIGLDLEFPREKVLTLYPKFLSSTECEEFDTNSVIELTRVWSAKEALYKLAGRKGVLFAEELIISRKDNNWYGEILSPSSVIRTELNIFDYKGTIVSINKEKRKIEYL
jgi:phosphopantetheinyl transferase